MILKCKKKIFQIVMVLLLCIFLIAVPVFCFHNISKNNLVYGSHITENGFLKVWQIDDFEGGSGNRTTFLEKISKDFETKNAGWSIVVQTLTQEEAFNAIKSGTTPDLISFSHYSGYMLEKVLKDYEGGVSTREDLIEYGMSNGKIKAVPWYMSAYCLIGNCDLYSNIDETLSTETMFNYSLSGKNSKPSLTVGLANNNLALLACIKNGITMARTSDIVTNFDTMTTFEAYNQFCNDYSSAVLLGTARDFYRVYNKMNLGTMSKCCFVPLNSWTDLIGYIGITSQNENNFEKANEFVEFLTSDVSQLKLSSIGLFSTNYLEIYQNDEHYSKFEKVLQRKIKSVNIFMPKEEKQKLWKASVNAIFGDVENLNYAKKFI